MKLKKLTKEELESMSYDDIAYKIFEEEKKKIKLPVLFRKICDLLELSDAEYEEKIGDFFQLISRDQRFTMLENGFWDLKEKYKSQIIMHEDEEDTDTEDTEDDTDITEEDEKEETSYYDEDSEDDDVEEDDLKDLVIISDEEDDEANLN